MFVSWGSHGALAQVDSGNVRVCEHCTEEAPYSTMVEYRVRHVWWLFRWATDKIFYFLCSACQGTIGADESQLDQANVRRAIPFMDRRGWMVGAGAVAGLLLIGSVLAVVDSNRNREFVAAPHVGDIYTIDLARILEHPERSVMIGAVEVADIRAGQMDLLLPTVYYDRASGVADDIRRRETARATYFAAEHLTVPASAIQRLYDEGIIQDVDRGTM
jgi:hypothetical protein